MIEGEELPSLESKVYATRIKHVFENVNGKDRWIEFSLAHQPRPIMMHEYKLNEAPLRAVDGYQTIFAPQPVQQAIMLKEALKAAHHNMYGIQPIDLSLPGQSRSEPVFALSSRFVDYKADPVGGIHTSFLLHLQGTHHDLGEPHRGWTGQETRALVKVHWVPGIGLIVDAQSHRDQSQTIASLANVEKMQGLKELVTGVDETILQAQEKIILFPKQLFSPKSGEIGA